MKEQRKRRSFKEKLRVWGRKSRGERTEKRSVAKW